MGISSPSDRRAGPDKYHADQRRLRDGASPRLPTLRLHPDEAAPDTDNIYGNAGETDTVTLLSAIGGESEKGRQKKTLRVTLPTRVNVERGVRIIVE